MEEKYKKKLKIKWKSIIVIIIALFLLILLVICFKKILNWSNDSSNTNKNIENILNEVPVIEVEDTKQTTIIENEETTKEDPYWDFIKMNLIDVNISDLKKKNTDTIGWIKVNGTNVNYPFVQTTDNNYYLNHSFDKTNNSAGWIFMDYRNSKDIYDKNTIIYGHSRLLNKSMFSTLKTTLKDNWLKNKDNHIIKISTETENSLWQIFSIYHIKTTIDYLKINFDNNEEFLDFSNMLLKRSIYDFKTTVNENDKILTLSTCYNDDEKLVIHAKLIKSEKK